MKRPTNDQIRQLRNHSKKLEELEKKIEAGIRKYNQTLSELFNQIQADKQDYESELEETNEFLESVHSEMQEYFDERSEKWQESEKGSAYQDWMDEWNSPLNEVELPEPQELLIEGLDAAEILDNLPEEPYE